MCIILCKTISNDIYDEQQLRYGKVRSRPRTDSLYLVDPTNSHFLLGLDFRTLVCLWIPSH